MRSSQPSKCDLASQFVTQNSSSFYLLDERIQKYIWAEKWEALREAQELAIPHIVGGQKDVIVAAATAAGKTEAAFLPALTHLLQTSPMGLVVYVSPLKALINDQFERLSRLCEQLDVPVWPWHGDVSATQKTRFLANPRGVLLITPESLEATFCLRGTSLGRIFERTTFLVIDELHAFIGTERGKQLQSLMHRLDVLLKRKVTRIGLSATLGDMGLARKYLRPDNASDVRVIHSKSEGGELQVLVMGFEEPLSKPPEKKYPDTKTAKETMDEDPPEPATPAHIAKNLFDNLRGSNNLIFPNSRREVERYTYLLDQMSKVRRVPNEFWPHHGNLSNEIRTETEAALKQRERPASAVCTSTLELGIDIGAVKSVAQIGPPPAVASLRQRLGRSGRRPGEAAILRGYTIETTLDGKSPLMTELRLDTLKLTAMITLLAEGWFEPPKSGGIHLSTLVQQVLSVIAQLGGASVGQLYALLCAQGGPFEGVTKAEFVTLIRHLGEKEILLQDSSGDLLHGTVGEKLVSHYSFYAAFASDDEFRVVGDGRSLGTIPVSQMLSEGQKILFAGRTWRIESVDEARKTIYVRRTGGGVPPMFLGGAGRCHTKVRQRMRELLERSSMPTFLNATAQRFLLEARRTYEMRNMRNLTFIDQGGDILFLTWLGDAGNEALACLFQRRNFEAFAVDLGVEVRKTASRQANQIFDALYDAGMSEAPPPQMLLANALNLQREKWDSLLPEPLLQKAYASLHLNVEEARLWASKVCADIPRR